MEPTNTTTSECSHHDSMAEMRNGRDDDQQQQKHVEFYIVKEWNDDCYKLDSNNTLPTVESSFEDDEDDNDDDMTYDKERYQHDDDDDSTTTTTQKDENDIPAPYDNNDEMNTSRKTRKMRFDMSRNQVYEVLNIDTYTAKELQKCWFTKEEIHKLKERREKIIARMDAGKPSKGSLCYRGLDHLTIQGTQRLDTLVDTLINQVINEQDRQWDLDIINQSREATINGETRIASISRNISAICQIEARAKAQQDEVEATSIHFEHLMSTISSSPDDSDEDEEDNFDAVTRRRGSTSGLDSSIEETEQGNKNKKKNSKSKSDNKKKTTGKNNRRATKTTNIMQQQQRQDPSPPSPGERFDRGTLQIQKQRSSLSQLFSKKYMPVA